MRNKVIDVVSAISVRFTNRSKTYRSQILTIVLMGLMLFTGCQKDLDVGLPEHSLPTAVVFTDQGSANSAIAGMYGNLYTITNTYAYSISLVNGMAADELTNTTTTWDQYKTNSLLSNESNVAAVWTDSYLAIYRANAIIEGMESSSLPTAFKNQATGEALFIRAFCHFYLVNLYGDVPLITNTVVAENQVKPRTPSNLVWEQITADLEKAQALLPVAYPSVTNRTRVNKYAAAAMLARVYLYQKNYASAEAKATEVIALSLGASPTYTLLPDLNNVFLSSSTESIFSFDTSVYGYPWVGSQTVTTSPAVPSYIITPGLLAAFEPGDKRKTSWVALAAGGQSYPNKYRTRTNVKTEYDVVLRLAEQYLIRAEARINQPGKVELGIADLNVIRARARALPTADVTAPLPALSTALSTADALLAVEKERRVELFTEWGHRWLDLKRTNRADAVLGVLKLGLWQPTDVLYPIPSGEREKNPNLSQNLGYF